VIGGGYIFYHTIYSLAIIMVPLLVALFLTAVVTEFAQIGPIFTTETMKFDLSKLNPFEGIKKVIFNVRSLFELVKSMIKVGVLAYFAYQCLEKHTTEIFNLIRVDNVFGVIVIFGTVFYDFTVKSIGFLLVVAILDY